MTLQEKRTRMLSLIDNWKESGMSQVEFAREHQIGLAKFRYWINQQRKGQAAGPAFVELNSFSQTGIRIRYPNGVELCLPAQTSVVVIRSLINF
jgi:transposase-like protein